MSSGNKPLGPEELLAFERQRDFGAELLQSIKEMKAGVGKVVFSPILNVRREHGLSQQALADLFAVNLDQVRAWEEGRSSPVGAVALLLQLASEYPAIFRAITKLDMAK